MKNTKLINNILGWAVFAFSLMVYALTLEPSASWWDCSEIITSGYKLEVGHPPGAPIHVLLSRFFTLFATDPSKAALMVNFMSASASAATVMLLYWSIVYLARKLFHAVELSKGEQLAVWGSGLVGSLGFAFTDTFWFSAVEGEVYALSSFFTAAVFLATLKWESHANEPGGNRWLILIAYLIGLSIGVHLLSLLVIPVIGLIWFFRNKSFSWPGLIKAFLLSGIILFTIQYLIIPGTAQLAFYFDTLFVNTFGLPFNSGVVFLFFVLVTGGFAGIYLTYRKKWVVLNTIFVSLLFIYIGYSSYAMILIRASVNPPMNQNHPDNAFALKKYLSREQYGNRPFLFGHYYSAPAVGLTGLKPEYNQIAKRYEITGQMPEKVTYDSRFNTFFPRMYSSDPYHIQAYGHWGRVKGKPVSVNDYQGERTITKPSFTENIRFFLNYQMGYMYIRYFMWNFAGRQNDIQGQGGFRHGNWISGIRFLDEPRTGPEKKLPPGMKNNPSRNAYYFLPLLLGFAGMFYQYQQGKPGKQGFWVILLLFFMTGAAIVIYLNQTPMQPRERDYAFVGSFFAFSLWIGLGVLSLFSFLKKKFSEKYASMLSVLLSFLCVPLLLLSRNYRDHDRSGRYMVRDYARNYLESCAPGAILFTYGDNDTFPLWYAQEVEGIRRDIRVVNMGLLGLDWYISQLAYSQNEAAPVKFSWTRDKYFMGKRDAVLIIGKNRTPVDLNHAMAFAASDDPQNKVKVTTGELYNYFPSESFFIPVDKPKIMAAGVVRPENESLISDSVIFSIDKPYLSKSDVAILNIIAANNWERPVYFNHSTLYSGSMYFNDWVQFEGLTYRLIPIRSANRGEFTGRIDTEILYENVMYKFTWGNVNHPDVYLDEYNRHEIKLIQGRSVFSRLAAALNDEGKAKKAEEVLDRLFEIFPDSKIPLTYDSFPAAEEYFRAGAIEKGKTLIGLLVKNSLANLDYYVSIPRSKSADTREEEDREISLLQNLKTLALKYGEEEVADTLNAQIDEFIRKLQPGKTP